MESILWSDLNIRKNRDQEEQRPRVSTFYNVFIGDLLTPPGLPSSPSINQPTLFLLASEQSLSIEQAKLSVLILPYR